MNYSIIMIPQAKNDLREIFRYIAFDLQSIQNATGQLERLETAIASLTTMPERFRVFDNPIWRERNLRIMPVDHYLVFYIPSREDRTVTVLRVLYGGRDIDSQLKRIGEF